MWISVIYFSQCAKMGREKIIFMDQFLFFGLFGYIMAGAMLSMRNPLHTPEKYFGVSGCEVTESSWDLLSNFSSSFFVFPRFFHRHSFFFLSFIAILSFTFASNHFLMHFHLNNFPSFLHFSSYNHGGDQHHCHRFHQASRGYCFMSAGLRFPSTPLRPRGLVITTEVRSRLNRKITTTHLGPGQNRRRVGPQSGVSPGEISHTWSL